MKRYCLFLILAATAGFVGTRRLGDQIGVAICRAFNQGGEA